MRPVSLPPVARVALPYETPAAGLGAVEELVETLLVVEEAAEIIVWAAEASLLVGGGMARPGDAREARDGARADEGGEGAAAGGNWVRVVLVEGEVGGPTW